MDWFNVPSRLIDRATMPTRARINRPKRRREHRLEDADYWLHAAPMAVRKASALREDKSFAPLP